jgi:hypothetical protein
LQEGFLPLFFSAFFSTFSGGGGAEMMCFKASSNLTPCNLKSLAVFGMVYLLYLLAVWHFACASHNKNPNQNQNAE